MVSMLVVFPDIDPLMTSIMLVNVGYDMNVPGYDLDMAF